MDAEVSERRNLVATGLRQVGLSAAVVTDPRDIEYLTAADPLTPLGPNPFTGPVSSALVLTPEGESTVVVSEPDLSLTGLGERGITTAVFSTFEDLTSLRPRERLGAEIARVLRGLDLPAAATIGIEPSALPAHVTAYVREVYPQVRFAEVESLIAARRSIKSAAEVGRIRRAVALCDHAQGAAARALGAGGSPADVRTAIQASLEIEAGAPVVALVEVSSRGLSAADGRGPVHGSMVITDIAPRWGGYWGDSCHTRPRGEGASGSEPVLAAVSAALSYGIEAVRPGARACDVDGVMRRRVGEAYPTYTGAGGHAIGLDYHESPRLTPNDTTVLETGMVLALEPGVYLEDLAARLEVVVTVVPGGCEVLSGHLVKTLA